MEQAAIAASGTCALMANTGDYSSMSRSYDRVTRDNVALYAENARLQKEIGKLKDDLLTIKEDFGFVPVRFPGIWHFTKKEEDVLAVLLARPAASKEQLMVGVYGSNAADWPETKIVDVFVCKLRKKMDSYRNGITIKTLWGRGYTIGPQTRAAINDCMRNLDFRPWFALLDASGGEPPFGDDDAASFQQGTGLGHGEVGSKIAIQSRHYTPSSAL